MSKIQCKKMALFCHTINSVPSPDVLTGAIPFFFFFFFKFDRLGVKLSTLMISPWIKKGIVVVRPPNGLMPGRV
jgi:phospholipase C